MRYLQMLLGFLVVAFSAGVVHAGPRSGGGGDLCENRIQVVRDDIKSWILNGGAKNLKLPVGISAGQYSTSVISQIRDAKISCVGPGDDGYPVQISGTPKVCVFLDGVDKRIICDYDKFQKLRQSDQYVLIHHEFAGLAKLEKPMDETSTYLISNQISGYLENEVTSHLVVKNLGEFPTTDLYCVSRIVTTGRSTQNVRGPEFQMRHEHRATAEVPGYSNFKPWHWAYMATAQANGSIAVDIDLGKQVDGYPKPDSTSATHAIGFATGSAFLEAYTWLYPNLEARVGCKIGVFRVVCAANEEIANRAANVCAGAVSDSSICLPTTSKMPKGCSL